MKAVILEIEGKKAVALSDDGLINGIRNKGYTVGQTIEMEARNMTKTTKKFTKMAASVAAALVILLGGGTAFAYNAPAAHVSMDVNPSITYTLNMFDRVIDVEMANEDAEEILDTIDWDGEELEVVVERTIAALKDKDYLDTDNWYDDSITIGVNSDSERTEKRLVKAIKDELENIIFEETGDEVDLEENDVVVVGVGEERVAEAARLSEELDMKVTPGKLNLVQKLGESYENAGEDPLNTDEEMGAWLEKPVKEIMAQIKANKGTGNPDQVTPPGLMKKEALEDPDAIMEKENEIQNENQNEKQNSNKGNKKAQ